MRKTSKILVGVALMFMLAGCIGSSAQSTSDFQNESELVSEVTENESVITFEITENAEYSTQNCNWNPATKTTVCHTNYHDTDISEIRIQHNDSTVRTLDESENYEGHRLNVNATENGDYRIVLDYESGDENWITFNKSQSEFGDFKGSK